MENFSTVLVAFISGVLGPISIMLIKYYLDQKKKNKYLAKAGKKTKELNPNHRHENVDEIIVVRNANFRIREILFFNSNSISQRQKSIIDIMCENNFHFILNISINTSVSNFSCFWNRCNWICLSK